MRTSLRVVLCLTGFLSGPVGAAATFQIPDAALPEPLILVAYGDMRFTDTGETAASSPRARRALIAKIATENPAAIFINGDLPYHGVAADYQVFRAETRVWRDEHLRVYPALGNHELSACFIASCLMGSLTWFPAAAARRPTTSTALRPISIKIRISRTITTCASNCAARPSAAR